MCHAAQGRTGVRKVIVLAMQLRETVACKTFDLMPCNHSFIACSECCTFGLLLNPTADLQKNASK